MKRLLFICTILLLFGCHHQPIQIDQLIFHTSLCFGTCPVYHLEIDGKKNAKLFAETVFDQKKEFRYELDTNKIGYFTGKLTEKEFAGLSSELNRIRFDTLQSDSVLCCDGSLITLILYQQGKRKEIKTMFEPKTLQPIISKLYQICSHNKFKRTDSAFTIEGSKSINKQLMPPAR